MLADLGCPRSSSATRSAGSSSARPTRAWHEEGPTRRWITACCPSCAWARPRRSGRRGRRRRSSPGSSRPAWCCCRPTTRRRVAVAYEPIWAIGTGQDRDSGDGPGGVRPSSGRRWRPLWAAAERRGSACALRRAACKPDNIDELMAQPDIDGVLVGGASLEVESFARIVRVRGAVSRVREPGPRRRGGPRSSWTAGVRAARAGQRHLPGQHSGLGRPAGRSTPHVLLEASGEAVGLPAGVMGNSEVGHLTLGSGPGASTRTSPASTGPSSTGRSSRTRSSPASWQPPPSAGQALHLMGLLSDAGVHSAMGHLNALVRLAGQAGVDRLYIHAFTDGRDTSPTARRGLRRGARERSWPRRASASSPPSRAVTTPWTATSGGTGSKLAYDALVHGDGLSGARMRRPRCRSRTTGTRPTSSSCPTVVCADPASRVGTADGVVFFNFRPDRARELCAAFTQVDFTGFDRGPDPPLVDLVGMTEYDPRLGLGVAFPKEEPRHVLAEVVSEAGLTQLHIAETEKYAHVTFFFNGGREAPFPGEKRCSGAVAQGRAPRTTRSPQMSAYEVVDNFEQIMARRPGGFRGAQLRQPGYGGPHRATCPRPSRRSSTSTAAWAGCSRSCGGAERRPWSRPTTATPSSCSQPDGSADTAHSTNQVPLIVLDEHVRLREGAGLADVAPTVLCFLGLSAPAEMTGEALC